jgi:chlorobactene glucosyltransferase
MNVPAEVTRMANFFSSGADAFSSSWGIVFHGFVIVSLCGALTTVVLHLLVMPRLRPARWNSGEAPRVSILVPARNEEATIAPCVASLLAQDYPHFRLHVLDDHSTDKTAQIVESLGLTEANGGLIRGGHLPAGWVGKNWACHQLSRVADGEYLLFTDADTVHAPESVSALVAAAREHDAILVSAWPRQIMGTWSEKLVVSLLPFVGVVFYPHLLLSILGRNPGWRRKVPPAVRRFLGAANGQVLFFKREGYDRIGGHAGLRDHLVEDIALGRAVAQKMGEGYWWVNCDSAGLVKCRMYRSFGEVWEGFSKNTRAAFESRHATFWAFGLWQTLVFVLPFFLVFFSTHLLPALAEVFLLWLIRSLVVLFHGGSWWSVCFHPVAYALALAIGFNSWRRSRGAGVRWKGRLYPVRFDFSAKSPE